MKKYSAPGDGQAKMWQFVRRGLRLRENSGIHRAAITFRRGRDGSSSASHFHIETRDFFEYYLNGSSSSAPSTQHVPRRTREFSGARHVRVRAQVFLEFYVRLCKHVRILRASIAVPRAQTNFSKAGLLRVKMNEVLERQDMRILRASAASR